MKYKRLDWENC